MEIVTEEQIAEWLRIDPETDVDTLEMLVASAIDIIEHDTGRVLRAYTDPVTLEDVQPIVPESLKHAIAIFVSGHFDDRTGDNAAAMMTLKRLCAPYRVARL